MFLLGGTSYVLLELLARGRSHISMFAAGGLCCLLIFRLCCVGRLRHARRFWRCAVGSVLITAVEFATGLLVNVWLELQVWNYSALPFNLLGQVCLRYSLLWGLLTLPVLWLGEKVAAFTPATNA